MTISRFLLGVVVLARHQFTELEIASDGAFSFVSGPKLPFLAEAESNDANFWNLFRVDPESALTMDHLPLLEESEAVFVGVHAQDVIPVVFVVLPPVRGNSLRILLADNSLKKLAAYRAASYRRNAIAAQLCGKLSHDINNYLGAITGATSILQRALSDENNKRRLGMIQSATEKLSLLSSEMAEYSAQAERRVELCPVGDVVSFLDKYFRPFSLSRIFGRIEYSNVESVRTNCEQLGAALAFLPEVIGCASPIDLSFGIEVLKSETKGVGGVALPPGAYVVLSVTQAMGGQEMYKRWSQFFFPERESWHSGLEWMSSRIFQSQGGSIGRLESEKGEVGKVKMEEPKNNVTGEAGNLLRKLYLSGK